LTTITRRPRGFTLVELLVVIGIILVLIAIVVMGIRHTGYMASRHETEVEMKVLGDILAEYQAINGMKNIEGAPNLGAPVSMTLPDPPYLHRGYTLPIYIDQLDETTEGVHPSTSIFVTDLKGSMSPKNPPTPAESGDMSDKGNGNNPCYTSKAMYNMMGIMYILLKDPKNRALIANLPPKRILETWSSFSGGPANLPKFTIDAAIPLDGWGNPIFFVPRGGLHVFLDPAGLHDLQNSARTGTVDEYVVRTSGTYSIANLPRISPNDRPFFASAGPDGYVSDLSAAGPKVDRAADNFYSFQAQ